MNVRTSLMYVHTHTHSRSRFNEPFNSANHISQRCWRALEPLWWAWAGVE